MPSSLTTSQTSASAPGPLARTSTEIGRPAPYLTALDSRFVTICSSRRRSQAPSIAPSRLHVYRARLGLSRL